MLQYWFYVLSSLLDAVFSSVNNAFGNSISLDAVVVLGSYAGIYSLGHNFLTIGSQAYKLLQSNAKNCLLLNIIASVIWGATVLVLSEYLPGLFKLTEAQHEMFSQLLVCYALFCPIEGAANFFGKYCIFKCYNKLQIIGTGVSWTVLFLADWLAVTLGFGCVGIVFSTGLGWLSNLIIFFFGTKFWTIPDKIQLKSLLHAFNIGKDYTLSTIAQRLANIVLGHYASTLGTEQYAVYSVAFAAVSSAEELRAAYSNYCIVRLRNCNKRKEQKAKRLFKQVGWLGFLLLVCLSFGLAFISHGTVPLAAALGGVVLYIPSFLLHPIYDLLEAFAASRGKSKYALGCGVATVFARGFLPFLLSIVLSSLNIFLIVICYIMDYLGRTVWLFIRLSLDKRQQLHLTDAKEVCYGGESNKTS